ncbi:hypothetical protein ANANG_G00201340 [Anguilla anguilla]|uniref:protein-tyrosine-phosphatase n=1 Tax=Anguilla anguilla TaxID=7936 RepID=A0A9D3RQ68_ANGAN|nr:hypothetical protein ANANG_G00201340 [Anguilla anguilla]
MPVDVVIVPPERRLWSEMKLKIRVRRMKERRDLRGGFAAFSSCFPGLCEGKPAPILPMSLSQPCMPVANVGPTRILPHLYLGSQKDVLNKDLMAQNGITYVLNASNTCPKPDFICESRFMRIPVNDNYCEKLLPWLEKTNDFIDKAKVSNCRVIVHCLAGISRSATIAIAYIMKTMGLSSDDAYRFVKDRRPSISPNFNFLGQLLEFEKGLRLLMALSSGPGRAPLAPDPEPRSRTPRRDGAAEERALRFRGAVRGPGGRVQAGLPRLAPAGLQRAPPVGRAHPGHQPAEALLLPGHQVGLLPRAPQGQGHPHPGPHPRRLRGRPQTVQAGQPRDRQRRLPVLAVAGQPRLGGRVPAGGGGFGAGSGEGAAEAEGEGAGRRRSLAGPLPQPEPGPRGGGGGVLKSPSLDENLKASLLLSLPGVGGAWTKHRDPAPATTPDTPTGESPWFFGSSGEPRWAGAVARGRRRQRGAGRQRCAFGSSSAYLAFGCSGLPGPCEAGVRLRDKPRERRTPAAAAGMRTHPTAAAAAAGMRTRPTAAVVAAAAAAETPAALPPALTNSSSGAAARWSSRKESPTRAREDLGKIGKQSSFSGSMEIIEVS